MLASSHTSLATNDEKEPDLPGRVDLRSPGFLGDVVIGRSVLADERILDPAFRTYCRLRWLASSQSSLTFTDQDFQEHFGVSRRTLYRHLALLASLDVLRYHSCGGPATRWYRVEFLEVAAVAPASATAHFPADEPATQPADDPSIGAPAVAVGVILGVDLPRDHDQLGTDWPGDNARVGTDWLGNNARVGTDWLGDHAKVGATLPKVSDKVGTYLINTSSSSSLTPVNFNKNILNRGGKEEEEEVNIKSAKNGNPLPAFGWPALGKPALARPALGWSTKGWQTQRTAPCQVRHPESYPHTMTQASNHPDIQLYREITGLFPGERSWRGIIDAMGLLRQKYPGQDLKAVLPEYWAAWQSGRRKDGRPFDRFSLPWLTEWATSGVIPDWRWRSPAEERHPDPRPIDVVNRRRAAMAAAEAAQAVATTVAATLAGA